MTAITVKVDQDTAIAAQTLRWLLESPGGADLRAGASISVDTLERFIEATTKLYVLTARLKTNAAHAAAAPRETHEYTFEILNSDDAVVSHAVVKWWADDPAGARSAAVAQQAQSDRFSPAARIGKLPVSVQPLAGCAS